MGFYRFADRVFELKNRYPYTERFCSDYAVPDTEADWTIEIDDDALERERAEAAKTPQPSCSEGYLEFIAFHRRVAELLSSDGCVLMHGAAIKCGERDGNGRERAYIFTAKSGTGKTTHISLWKKLFGDSVTVINGDKPILRRNAETGGFTVYGTPWCGKERLGENTAAELCGIVLLGRAEKNNISYMSAEEAIPPLLGQLFYKTDGPYLAYLLETLDLIVKNIPIYKLGCNMEDEAAILAHSVLCGEKQML